MLHDSLDYINRWTEKGFIFITFGLLAKTPNDRHNIHRCAHHA
jgi:hypothetical protein